jgi:hypothetical protein
MATAPEPKISSREDLEGWLEDKPADWAQAIAACKYPAHDMTAAALNRQAPSTETRRNLSTVFLFPAKSHERFRRGRRRT